MITTAIKLSNGTNIGYLIARDGQVDYSRIIISTDTEKLLLETKCLEKGPLPKNSIEIMEWEGSQTEQSGSLFNANTRVQSIKDM